VAKVETVKMLISAFANTVEIEAITPINEKSSGPLTLKQLHP
jgi:hypothetical protein